MFLVQGGEYTAWRRDYIHREVLELFFAAGGEVVDLLLGGAVDVVGEMGNVVLDLVGLVDGVLDGLDDVVVHDGLVDGAFGLHHLSFDGLLVP